jgi:isoleucyl-tRNA synthetase
VSLDPSVLAELFIVSDVKFAPIAGVTPEDSILIEPCTEHGYLRCPRCWRWVPKIVTTPHGEVCPRCAEALNSRPI